MNKNYTPGIDVSRWQDSNSTPQPVDFDKAYQAGARFVFIKASQANWKDEDVILNWQNAKKAGLLRGAYHFLVWDVDPKVQAQTLWNVIKDDPGELPPVADFEWWKIVPQNAQDILWRFVSELERLCKRKPIIYTAPYFWRTYGKSIGWDQYPLWIAHYGVNFPETPKPWAFWDFWQYSTKGDGLAHGCESKNVDMNYFNGTLDELKQRFGVTTQPPAPAELTDSEKLAKLWAAHPELH